MRPVLRIFDAEAIGDHLLRVEFSDGTETIVDVLPLLDGPVFEPLRDPAYFARVTLDPVCGTVVWPNGADLAPEALHALRAEALLPESRQTVPWGSLL